MSTTERNTEDDDCSDSEAREGILSPLVGHDGAKAIVRSALRRGDVDIMLSGPPASGKSVVLLAIEEAVPGAKYLDARGVSERELRDILSDDPPLLLLDEIDNMDSDPFNALNTAMEQGRVTKAVSGDSYDVEISTQFFGATNAIDPVPDDVLDRFVTVDFDPYTREEFIEVCEVLLPEQVGWVSEQPSPTTTARSIATTVWDETESNSPRKARDAARLADAPGRVEAIIAAMDDPKADVESDPINPDEIAATKREDRAGDGTKTLADIRENMADPDEIGTKDASEIEALFEDDGGDDGQGEGTEDQVSETPSETGGGEDVQPDQESGTKTLEDLGDDDGGDDDGEYQDWRADGFTEEHVQKAREYIEQTREAAGAVVSINTEGRIFEILVPRDRKDEVLELIRSEQITPTAPTIISQAPVFYEEADSEFAQGLASFQFDYDDREDAASTGYDLHSIVESLEASDIEVMYGAVGVLDDVPSPD